MKYIDVIHGRMMGSSKYCFKNYGNYTTICNKNIIYIILNVLTGYISTDHMIHVDRKKVKQLFLIKIEEIDNSIALLKASMGGDTGGSLRRLFTYVKCLYQQEGRMFVALIAKDLHRNHTSHR